MTFLGPKFDPQRRKILKKIIFNFSVKIHTILCTKMRLCTKNFWLIFRQNLRDSVRLRHYFPFSNLPLYGIQFWKNTGSLSNLCRVIRLSVRKFLISLSQSITVFFAKCEKNWIPQAGQKITLFFRNYSYRGWKAENRLFWRFLRPKKHFRRFEWFFRPLRIEFSAWKAESWAHFGPKLTSSSSEKS